MSDLWNRYQSVIAQGCLTNSKHPRSHIQDIYPKVFKKQIGNKLIDELGRSYIDYICGLGANLTGQSYLCGAKSPSFPTELEIMAAEKVKNFFPFIDKLKFLKTGTEACAAAIRIARTHTGKDLIMSDGYHGWSDDFVSLSEPACGVPKPRTWINKLDLSRIKETAAIIIEPVITDWSQARGKYLQELRELCDKNKVLLIFDEVITGLRFQNYSVSKYFGVYPDIICLGKSLGGGYPLAVVGGKREIMDNPDYFVSSTFAGEHSALEAWLLVNQFMLKNKIGDLWEEGQRFIDRFNEFPIDVKIEGYPTRGIFTGDKVQKALLFQEACEAGILFGPSWFFNYAHPGESDHVLNALGDIAYRINRGEIPLRGSLPQSPFAERIRKNG